MFFIVKKWGVPGIEPGTSSSLTKNHTTRLNTQLKINIYWSILLRLSVSECLLSWLVWQWSCPEQPAFFFLVQRHIAWLYQGLVQEWVDCCRNWPWLRRQNSLHNHELHSWPFTLCPCSPSSITKVLMSQIQLLNSWLGKDVFLVPRQVSILKNWQSHLRWVVSCF